MRTLPILAVATVTSVAALATPAHADGAYVSESFGGAKVSDDLARDADSMLQFRVAGGLRRGAWAVEGWLGVNAALGSYEAVGAYGAAPTDGAPCGCGQGSSVGGTSLFTYGVDVKYLQPVAPHVDVYLRGGLSYGHLDGEYQGRGVGAGAGIQIKGKVPALGLLFWPLFFTNLGPKITAAGFVDTGTSFYRLHKDGIVGNGSRDARLESLTVGFAIGSDF